jgi:hypothetical protein
MCAQKILLEANSLSMESEQSSTDVHFDSATTTSVPSANDITLVKILNVGQCSTNLFYRTERSSKGNKNKLFMIFDVGGSGGKLSGYYRAGTDSRNNYR